MMRMIIMMDVDDAVDHDNDEDDDGFWWWLMAMMMLALIMINILQFFCVLYHIDCHISTDSLS